jgi:hypothetical protein
MWVSGTVFFDNDVEVLAELELRLVKDGERFHLE